MLQISVQKRKKKKETEQPSHLFWGKTTALVCCFFYDVRMQTPTSGVWNHSPWAMRTCAFQEPRTCIPWVSELMGWQCSCWMEDIMERYSLSHFLVICLSCHSLLQNSWFFSFVLHSGKMQSDWCCVRYHFAWAEISASTEIVMTIHRENTVLWDGWTAIKKRILWL